MALPEQITAFESLVTARGGNSETSLDPFDPRLVMPRPCDLTEHYGVHLTTVLHWCGNGLITHYNLTLHTAASGRFVSIPLT